MPPIEGERESAMASRETLGGHLADRRWMRRVLDETWARVPEQPAPGPYTPLAQALAGGTAW